MQKKQLNKNIEMSPLVPGLNGDVLILLIF